MSASATAQQQNRPARRERAGVFHALAERFAIDPFHRVKTFRRVVGADVIDAYDVGMIEVRRGAGFVEKMPAAGLIGEQFFVDDLERDVLSPPRVKGLVSRPHAATSEPYKRTVGVRLNLEVLELEPLGGIGSLVTDAAWELTTHDEGTTICNRRSPSSAQRLFFEPGNGASGGTATITFP